MTVIFKGLLLYTIYFYQFDLIFVCSLMVRFPGPMISILLLDWREMRSTFLVSNFVGLNFYTVSSLIKINLYFRP